MTRRLDSYARAPWARAAWEAGGGRGRGASAAAERAGGGAAADFLLSQSNESDFRCPDFTHWLFPRGTLLFQPIYLVQEL